MVQFHFPELWAAVGEVDARRQRAASRAACELARDRTGLAGRDVDRAFAALEQERFGETFERVMMRDLAERLRLEAEEPVGEIWRRSCAAKALAWALHDDARRAADESISLAIVALDDDPSEIEQVVRVALDDQG